MSAPAQLTPHDLMMAASRSYRLNALSIRVDGQPLDFKRYCYLPKMLDDDHPDQSTKKAAQLGFTTTEILRVIDYMRTNPVRGVGYIFPRDADVSDFSKARFNRILGENEALRSIVQDTDSTNLKQIAGSYIYFRGAGEKGRVSKSEAKLKSVPFDIMILDERDEMSDERVEALMFRLSGSENPMIRRLSTPTVPMYGIDLDYEASDQQCWLWRCNHCNAWVSLEDDWPDCIAEIQDSVFYLCPKCREPIARDRGDWVAKRPSVTDKRGWFVSQLSSPTRSPLQVLLEWNKAQDTGRFTQFYRQTLARAYAEIEDELTEAMLKACLGPDPRLTRHEGPCVMGVDPGAKDLHYIVAGRVTDKDSEVYTWGKCADFSQIHDIAKAFNVQVGVIDAMAETRSVMNFVREHSGWFGCRYVDAPKPDFQWDPKARQVIVNRTDSLDASHQAITNSKVRFPRPDTRWHELVLPQMQNLVRTVRTHELTGEEKAVWIVRGTKNDHLRHAWNYATIALSRVSLTDRSRRAQRAHGPRPSTRPKGFMAR